ncbi:MAG TPA: hypothetical protein VN764_16465, partial [Polyangiaceae bacterium]|nr:hypothetical protein [Polyangiaceae bacterium]
MGAGALKSKHYGFHQESGRIHPKPLNALDKWHELAPEPEAGAAVFSGVSGEIASPLARIDEAR